MNNPFLIVGYQGPEYFCDREKETEVILSALHNGRNITLVSPRRMGKTGLIKNVFYTLQEKEKNAKCFYLDIFSTQNLREFVALLGREILGKLDSLSQSTLKTLLSFFKSCRPVITMDELSGIPSVSLDIVPSKEEETLKEIFDYLRQSGRECYLAIDEFQQIMEYPEKGVILFSGYDEFEYAKQAIKLGVTEYIQFLPNVHFIFSGSKKHLMEYIFFSIKRPFYQSTQKLFLDKISKEVYFSFAHSFFEKEGKELPEEIFDKVYTWVDGHTWYVQYLLNRLFALPEKTLSPELLDSLMMEILREEEYTYQTYFQLLTFNQIQLLKAIAKEGIVREVNAAAFIKKYDLKAVSSVNTSLRILIDKEFILRQPDGYIVYDRFMSIWLSRI